MGDRLISERDYLDFQQLMRMFKAGQLTNKAPNYRKRGAIAIASDISGVRRAFVKSAPGSSSLELNVYLDEYLTGEEATVWPDIVGGGGLGLAVPRMEVGDPLYIRLDSSQEPPIWRQAGNPFQGSEDC